MDAAAGLAPAYELWQMSRLCVSAIDQLVYPQGGSDVGVRFIDGSWTRWKVGDATKLASRFRGERKPVREDTLTPQQQQRVAELVANPPLSIARSVGRVLPDTEPPTLELLPDGIVAVELRVPLSNGTDRTLTRYLSPSGTDVLPKDPVK
ncbi:hypothetical protein [Streptomyces sp. NPDC001068]|uniref:hypothetical protein n=1 Tax=Streptomyces sp. NPDC001068 TaxID=3364544 RepID=UPI00369CB73F